MSVLHFEPTPIRGACDASEVWITIGLSSPSTEFGYFITNQTLNITLYIVLVYGLAATFSEIVHLLLQVAIWLKDR